MTAIVCSAVGHRNRCPDRRATTHIALGFSRIAFELDTDPDKDDEFDLDLDIEE